MVSPGQLTSALVYTHILWTILIDRLHCTVSNNTEVPHHQSISYILDELLQSYDSSLRPGYEKGAVTVVQADMNIRSMGPISEVDMTFSIDAYFRQTWVDRRLQFRGPMQEMAVHIRMLDLIWKPDPHFLNGQGSYLHTITTPNKLLRIRQDGTVLYSMRLTIKANCPMYLQAFPVDVQHCPLMFASYAYTSEQVMYVWKHGPNKSIKMAKDLRLSQYDLTGTPASTNKSVNNRIGVYSALSVEFKLRRHMGYFIIQIYVPCLLVVVLSWVSFWINREATADRVGLGVTSMLTLVTISVDSRKDLPRVPYATALDWFIIMCFVYVIGSLLEFAGVHFFTKVGSGDRMSESDSEDYEEECDTISNKWTKAENKSNAKYWTEMSDDRRGNCTYTYRADHISSSYGYQESCPVKFLRCLQGSDSYRKFLRQRRNINGFNRVSHIDQVSRVLFPFSFISLNVIYWIAYTTGLPEL